MDSQRKNLLEKMRPLLESLIQKNNAIASSEGFMKFVKFCQQIPGLLIYFSGTFIVYHFNDILTIIKEFDDNLVLTGMSFKEIEFKEEHLLILLKMGTVWCYEQLLTQTGLGVITDNSLFTIDDYSDVINRYNEMIIDVSKPFIDDDTLLKKDFDSNEHILFLRYLSYLTQNVFV